jgi:predicted transcriptional regulator of viral defense system
MKWPETHKKLAASGLRAFTDREFRAVTGSTPVSAKFLLIRYTKSGLLRRLRRGLYAVEGELPSQYALANRLYRPSYISMETALSYHHLIPETVYSMTAVTRFPSVSASRSSAINRRKPAISFFASVARSSIRVRESPAPATTPSSP